MTSALAGKVIDYDGSGNKKDAICAHYNGLRGEIHDDFTKNEGERMNLENSFAACASHVAIGYWIQNLSDTV